jgi:hypothetical protein
MEDSSMPNYVGQQLTIAGERAREVNEYVNGDDTPLDFNRVVPMPKDLDILSGSEGELGIDVLTGNCAKYLDYPWVRKEGITTIEDFRAYVETHRPNALQLGRQYLSNEAKYGHRTWYSWCCQYWGTKSNAYHTRQPEVTVRKAVVRFDTAWSPAIPVIGRLSELFPQVRFTLRYFDEGFFFAGTARCMAGQVSDQCFQPEPGDPQTQATYRHVYGVDLDHSEETE